jgi:hypothetical protein
MLSKDDAARDAHGRFRAGLIKAVAVSKAVRAMTRDAAAITRQLKQRQGGRRHDTTSSSPAFRVTIMSMRREDAQWPDER